MLTPPIEQTWYNVSEQERQLMLKLAKHIIGNMVHYQGSKRYYHDDLERIAAELLWVSNAKPEDLIARASGLR
jgi:hypothetical protein